MRTDILQKTKRLITNYSAYINWSSLVQKIKSRTLDILLKDSKYLIPFSLSSNLFKFIQFLATDRNMITVLKYVTQQAEKLISNKE